MKISLKGLSDQQKEQVKTIVTLGQTIGGNEKMDNYLMQQLMGVYMPETTDLDDWASAYSLTEDEGVKKRFLSKLYESKGLDPKAMEEEEAKKAQEAALFEQFSKEFPINSSDAGKNANLQQEARSNPGLMTDYYNSTPNNDFEWGWIPGGIGAGAALGAGVGAIGGPVGAVGGGVVGGIAGLLKSIFDSGEGKKEKEARLNKLIEQYKSNIPRN